MAKRKSHLQRVLIHHGLTALMALLAGVSLIPLLWLACASIKRDEDVYAYALLPWGKLNRLTFANFEGLLKSQFGNWMINSIFLASLSTVLSVLFSSMAGFALAKYRFRGKRLLLPCLLVTMLLPPQVMIGSLYELMNRLGWIDSYLAILVPGSVSVFGALLFRQAMGGVPDELMQCARIDGCSEIRLWWEIALPIVRPMVAAFTLMSFLASWNSFLWPQIILQDERKFTLPMGLNNLAGSSQYQHDMGMLTAGALLSILPVMALFFLMQRDFIAGLTSGAIKR